MNKNKKLKWNPQLAIEYIEGFGDGEGASANDILGAWAYLIKTGLCWQLQGYYGRTATGFIKAGYISDTGKVLKHN